MFARVTITQASPNLSLEETDKMTNHILEEIIPAARRMEGFKGGYWLGDRKTGKGLTVTLWESEDAERTSQTAATQLRQQAAAALNLQVKGVEVYEVLGQA
jgi:heme-degrading monooxygenase HmoA